jgi:hypothetical protein
MGKLCCGRYARCSQSAKYAHVVLDVRESLLSRAFLGQPAHHMVDALPTQLTRALSGASHVERHGFGFYVEEYSWLHFFQQKDLS